MGFHPTRSLEAVSHLALRPKLFNKILSRRIPSYESSTDPLKGHTQARAPPTIQCPHCEELAHSQPGLRLHCLSAHPDLVAPSPVHPAQVGVQTRQTKQGLIFGRSPQRNQAKSWAHIKGKTCPDCKMRCTSISACRYHWSLVCSHPLVKHCPGCQLLVRAAAKDSQRPGGPPSRSYIPPAVRVQSRSMHNCMSDPAIAPAIAKQSLARAGHAFRAKPATAAADPSPKGPQYRLLPPYTVRRFRVPKCG